MDQRPVADELKAYLTVLQKGGLTELDLDGLGNCLGNAVRTLEELAIEAEGGAMMRDDLVSEIVRLSRAASALVDGKSRFDAGALKEKLSECEVSGLLTIRKNVREGFARLLRSGDLPRKTVPVGESGVAVADYRTEDGRA